MLVPVIIVVLFCQSLGRPQTEIEKDESLMHMIHHHLRKRAAKLNVEETNAQYWMKNAQFAVNERISRKVNTNVAKNVIMFLGDGMSIPTLAAARMYLGSENHKLSFDEFPYTGLSMTYCVDKQVPDSACTATAYLGGVKGNLGTIGVTAAVELNDCDAMTNTSNYVDSIARWSQTKGKRTGLVTTARVTHASPAGIYAHTAQRNWEADSNIISDNQDPQICKDIAYQLVNWDTGNNLNVILGGGRGEFLPNNTVDEQGNRGNRSDGINLIDEWLENKSDQGQAEYVWNRDQLLNIDDSTDYLLGLFDASHIPYNLERNSSVVPSLEEMTEAAIKMLEKSPQGYFLFVEGARIDMAHHEAQARKAFEETSEFSKAVQKAVDITNEEDTLIVVTSDHAHTMSISGYPERGNDILGLGGKDMDGFFYTTINYANGMGYRTLDADGSRHDYSKDDFSDINYRYPGVFPMESETHGGDDVGIFARGPWSHLFTGVMEQNVIPHLMAYASCVSDGITVCDFLKES